MTAKEYLSQARYINQEIDSKLQQVASLRELATKTSMPMSDMPGSPNRTTDKLENTMTKIIDMGNTINEMVGRLIELKLEITFVVQKVEDTESRVLLEMRYLCFKQWDEIAVAMGYDIRHIYRLHQSALSKVQIPKTCQ